MQGSWQVKSLVAALATIGIGSGLTGCGGGGSDVGTNTGVVVGSYFQNAKVCLDENNNAVCDANEFSTRSDAQGRFTLPVANVPVVAEIGTDASRLDPDTGTASAVTDKLVFRAPAGNTAVLSALTTLVVAEMDGGASLADARSTVAGRLGVDGAKLMGDYNTETDSLTRSQLLAQGNNAIQTIAATVKTAGSDLKGGMGKTLTAKAVDSKVLYVWTQVGADDTTPFSKVSITGSSSAVALNADPVKGKVADATTYTVSDSSNGSPVSAGALYARAITTAATCPSITVDGVAQPMAVRAPAITQVDSNGQYSTGSKSVPVKADFAVLTCEFRIPDTARSAIVNGQALKLLNSSTALNRIVVIGDTGCRIKGPTAYTNGAGGDPLQDCTDDRAWPYKRIAAAAASFNPDLVIHNGDIHYREGTPVGVETPTGVAGTGKNEDFLQQKGLTPTITYGWAAWEADFFKPTGALLSAAPWAITRGNHESCFRAATGWFHFLDPRPFPTATGAAKEPKYSPTYDPSTCSDYIDPVAITLKDLQIVLLDNSGLQDDPGVGKNQGWTHGDHIRTARQLNALANLSASKDPTKVTWIVTHKPLFAYTGGTGAATPRTWQYQKAIAASGVNGVETYAGGNGSLPANTQMLHAGHIHGWQMISHPAASNLPTSFLIGVSGDTLEAGFMFDSATGAPFAPANFGTAITSGVWPWLGAKAALWFGSLAQYLPDAFSTSPIVNANDPAKARITDFGFVVFDRIPGTTNWTSTFYDMDRKKIRACTTVGKRTRCDG